MKTYNILTIEEFKKNIDNNSRLLGIDHGSKNIGLAIIGGNKQTIKNCRTENDAS